MSGVDDLKDVRQRTDATQQHVMQEMARRLRENLELRSDKELLRKQLDHQVKNINENKHFFNHVEGIGALDESDAVDGLFVVTQPRLGLARATEAMAVAEAAD
jgi:hypothetical protein